MDTNSAEESDILKRFPGQREGEVVEFVLRKHPVTLVPPALALLFALLLPMVFYGFIMPYSLPGFLYKPYGDIFFLLASVYYGFGWIILFVGFSDYYLDVLIITNKRIMNVEQRGLFNRIVSELEMEMIQDITSVVNGPIRTIFNFGDLQIQTASESMKINPRDIPHPVRVRRKIMELCEAMDKDKR